MFTNCITKFAFATKTGQSPSNPHKTNQDAWITVPHFCGLKYCHFFAVADGHGQWGREVSSQLKVRLQQYIEADLRYIFTKYHDELQQQQKNTELNTDECCIAFNNAFLNCNEELFNSQLDIRFSGSTCVSIMTLGQKLFCVNVGDSRAIVCKIVDDKLKTQAVSRDQKPCQADEAARIIQCGGRVDSFRDQNRQPIGPLRVWLKNEDIPGLAMTRSFGDEVASRVGVTCEPGKLI
jgi:serine/threonine protein phosphatase PrpC